MLVDTPAVSPVVVPNVGRYACGVPRRRPLFRLSPIALEKFVIDGKSVTILQPAQLTGLTFGPCLYPLSTLR
jgi:hypothetical protein